MIFIQFILLTIIFIFCRVTEQKRFSDHGYPENRTILTFEVSYTARKHLGEMSDDQIVKEVFDQFVNIGMAEKRLCKRIYRKTSSVNPVMKIGYEEELAFINSRVNKVEKLTFSRWFCRIYLR